MGDLLRRFDAWLAEGKALRDMIAALEPDEDDPDDLAEHNLISTQAASERWCIPPDTLRHKLRNDGDLGVKRHGVWLVSAPRFARRLRRS